jgi:hypothetical protein
MSTRFQWDAPGPLEPTLMRDDLVQEEVFR